ncbi:MAG: ABC transporter permease [Rhabdaerophilum sp.]
MTNHATIEAASDVPTFGPTRKLSAVGLIARKEAGEIVVSRRGRAWLLAMVGVLSGFSLLLVGSTELSLLDNAQVVYDMAGIVIALGALLALVVGSDAFAGEHERGSLTPLLLAPVSRHGILAGKIGGQMVAWAVMFVLALPYLWAVGSTGQNLIGAIVGLALFGTPVVLAFGLFSMGLGARLGSVRGTMMTMLVVLLLAASPLLIGPSLRQSTLGRWFDAVNPFSHAVNALDAMIIDSLGVAAQSIHLVAILAWLLFALAYAVRQTHRLVR